MNRVICGVFVATLLAACGSAPPVRPATEEAAIQWNQRGQEAYRHGEMQQALAAYEEALRLYSSVEQGEGIGIALLNVSTVYRRLGDRAAAVKALDRILAGGGIAIPTHYRAEAAYRRAHLDFEAGDIAGTSAWIERAQALCTETICDAVGRLPNLKARVALARDDISAAEAEARRGLDVNRRRGDALEEANSLRLLADAAVRRGQHPQAVAFYEQALALDKGAAEPGKIVLDLLGTSRSLAAQGKVTEAADYAERARRVAESIDDSQGEKEARSLK